MWNVKFFETLLKLPEYLTSNSKFQLHERSELFQNR